MNGEIVYIARCPEHGLHGQRDECFVCGGPVEQVPMVEAKDGVVNPLPPNFHASRDGEVHTHRVDPRCPACPDPTFEELSATIARYSDPEDKLTIALGNFNRVRAERDRLAAELEAIRDANSHSETE